MQKGVICMAEKYLARYGKVWKDRRTGKTLGAELELKKDDNISHYTQVSKEKDDSVESSEPTEKARKNTSIFEGGK